MTGAVRRRAGAAEGQTRRLMGRLAVKTGIADGGRRLGLSDHGWDSMAGTAHSADSPQEQAVLAGWLAGRGALTAQKAGLVGGEASQVAVKADLDRERQPVVAVVDSLGSPAEPDCHAVHAGDAMIPACLQTHQWKDSDKVRPADAEHHWDSSVAECAHGRAAGDMAQHVICVRRAARHSRVGGSPHHVNKHHPDHFGILPHAEHL